MREIGLGTVLEVTCFSHRSQFRPHHETMLTSLFVLWSFEIIPEGAHVAAKGAAPRPVAGDGIAEIFATQTIPQDVDQGLEDINAPVMIKLIPLLMKRKYQSVASTRLDSGNTSMNSVWEIKFTIIRLVFVGTIVGNPLPGTGAPERNASLQPLLV
jgi:hypothetical protein